MRRRDFIAGLGGALAMPVAVHAQQAMPLLGFISPVARDLFSYMFPPFLKGLGETGYVEGRNVLIDYRSTEGRNNLLPAVLADLLRRQVSLIVVAGNSQIAAAKAATTTVPIVFLTGEDPVKVGFVASLNRPGGNLTGVNTLGLAVGPKRLASPSLSAAGEGLGEYRVRRATRAPASSRSIEASMPLRNGGKII